ncbi:MAG: pentapeptide repeat-containing protein [Bacilli bacterium]
MKFEIKHKITGSILFSIETSSWKLAVEAAIKSKTNLRYANLSYANLSYADLSYADLRYANLRYANLSYADLRYADLRYANLRSANLSSADLSSANLDFSCWPLWCGSISAKLDIKQKRQLLYHLLAVAPEYRTKTLIKEANKFHRIGEVPVLKMPKKKKA